MAALTSSIIVGGFVTGTVPLVLGRIHELLPHHPTEQKAAWSVATVAFALFQAAAAYRDSLSCSRTVVATLQLLFVIGAAAMTLALAIDLISSHGPRQSR